MHVQCNENFRHPGSSVGRYKNQLLSYVGKEVGGGDGGDGGGGEGVGGGEGGGGRGEGD